MNEILSNEDTIVVSVSCSKKGKVRTLGLYVLLLFIAFF